MKKDRKMTRKKKKKSKKGRKKINVKFLLFLIGLVSSLFTIIMKNSFLACACLTISILLAFPYIAEDYEEYENLALVRFYAYCAVLIVFIVGWIIFFAYEIKKLLKGG